MFNSAIKKVFDGETLEMKKCFKCAKEWISDLKFAPNGQNIAIGSHDDAIYIYSVPAFKKRFRMKKHSSYLTHIDWSEDSMYLHSNCGAYELLFWDANSGKIFVYLLINKYI